jgi:hypothetical protein
MFITYLPWNSLDCIFQSASRAATVTELYAVGKGIQSTANRNKFSIFDSRFGSNLQ